MPEGLNATSKVVVQGVGLNELLVVLVVHEPAGSVERGYVKIRERSGSMWWEYVVVGRLLDGLPRLRVHTQAARRLLGSRQGVEVRVRIDVHG